MEVKIVRRLLKANDEWAEKIRNLLLASRVFSVNLISSPGSGKTTLLEQTVDRLKDKYKMLVLEGDIATTRDADRINKHGIPAIQLITEGSCHLDANLVYKALEEIDLPEMDIVFIENVGNLVCPSEFDLGEAAKVAVLSVPEGDDKLLKYPKLFREASCVILNKIDLLPYLDFKKDQFYADLKQLNPTIPVFEISCRTQEGLDSWIQWLTQRCLKK
jgi:hydrogenase nickel incorporation protein HypB